MIVLCKSGRKFLYLGLGLDGQWIYEVRHALHDYSILSLVLFFFPPIICFTFSKSCQGRRRGAMQLLRILPVQGPAMADQSKADSAITLLRAEPEMFVCYPSPAEVPQHTGPTCLTKLYPPTQGRCKVLAFLDNVGQGG